MYKPEIDGLRAIAVMGVFLYHLNLSFIKGGFLGVDIFFVISGYLISGLLYQKQKAGEFTLKEFYVNRARRLMPALFLTLFLSLIASAFILSPNDLIAFSKSLIAAIFSFSNIFFFSEAGYWDTASELKPLLHTWSLGVEEQFYLLWPLFTCFWLYKKPKSVIRKILVFLIVMGVIASELLLRYDQAAAFYLLPARVFEFTFGALLYFTERKKSSEKKNIKNVSFIISLLGATFCFVTYSSESNFPGISAIMPCLFAVILIWSSNDGIGKKILGNKYLTYIGKLSYSIYLIHWPLIVFYKRIFGNKLQFLDQVYILVATFLVSVCVHHFVENKYRYGKTKERASKHYFQFQSHIIITTTLLITVSTIIVIQGGWAWRYPEKNRSMAKLTLKQVNQERNVYKKELCRKRTYSLCGELKDNSILVLGDSHGSDGLNIALTAYPNANFLISGNGGCPPLINLEGVDYQNKNCEKINEKLFEDLGLLDKEHISFILFSIRHDRDRITGLYETLDYLESLGFEVKVMGVGPWFNKSPHALFMKNQNVEKAESALNIHQKSKIFEIRKNLQEADANSDWELIDKLAFFCPNQKCRLLTTDRKAFNVFDSHHLTYPAAIEFGEHLKGLSNSD